MSMIGVRYVRGGADPSGFDCSGLMYWAWGRAGRTLARSSSAQYATTRRISAGDLQPGDLVFYFSPVSHVAMYIGNGQIVDALNSSTPVGVRSIGYPGPVTGYGRP
jgi:cell wall-associated NlpC family hydrolase